MWTQEDEDSENLAPLTELKTGGATTNSGEAGGNNNSCIAMVMGDQYCCFNCSARRIV